MTYVALNTIRADEATLTYRFAGEGIVWAVLDSGIHRNHVHFKDHNNLVLPSPLRHADFSTADLNENSREEALIDSYGHGTHVAGIICGESWFENNHYLGVAPKCKVLSVKVTDESGLNIEKNILSALSWIKSVNRSANKPIIHGLLVGLLLPQDVRNFACGLTPLCEAINDLVESGVVVVTGAGNFGYREDKDSGAQTPIWGGITDPGNAELAITVGSTHRRVPRDYGPSYFSSRGPTLDGRLKPDLLAPGERIDSCWVDPELPAAKRGKRTAKDSFGLQSYKMLNGTSMAAAFVSGAAALLLSARPELIGRPLQVKRLIMESATDLKRDPWAQGRGLLDVAKLISIAQDPADADLSTTPTRRTESQPILATNETQALLPEAQRVPAAVAVGGKTFVVALSFPGTHRKLVEDVGRELRSQMPSLRRSNVFLDSYHKPALARPGHDTYLQDIYAKDSELLVVFLGGDYEKSDWCKLEWRVVRELIKSRRDDEVMLLRLDAAPVSGLLSIDGYLDVENSEADEIAAKIIERLELNRNAKGTLNSRS